MKNLVKHFGLLITLVVLAQSCSHTNYTSSKYFNCKVGTFDQFRNDTTQLVYALLHHACVKDRDVPDFNLLKDKQKLFVENVIFKDSFSNPDTTKHHQPNKLIAIPLKIDNVNFCLKSISELSQIANKKGRFIYIQIGAISIEHNKASIGISTNWILPRSAKVFMLSGGGYMADFQKINGQWLFTRKTSVWNS